jgi:lipopolysaccharide transport system ATP-binding protein
MTKAAVVAEQLSKTYRLYPSPWARLWEGLSRRPAHREFRALEDVSFSLRRGEGLAILGENGAGKSTLLKILAGISLPTRGKIEVAGRIASILELGSGFHPDFTGRQNILLNGSILGLSEVELRRRMPEIIEFSELGEFIDQPIKCYSTGMTMRLGFAIATQVEPDILIIDEALSVGDGYFQKKCIDRLLIFVNGGGTLLFCSHAMYYVSAFCQRALWLRQGRVEALGPVDSVVRDYENFLLHKAAPSSEEGNAPAGPARLGTVRLLDRPGDAGAAYRRGDPLELEIAWESERADLKFHLGVGCNRVDGVEVFTCGSLTAGLAPWSGRSGRVRFRIPELPLVKGEFSLYVFLLDEAGLHIYDKKLLHAAFAVENEAYEFGLIRVSHSWRLAEEMSPLEPSLALRERM